MSTFYVTVGTSRAVLDSIAFTCGASIEYGRDYIKITVDDDSEADDVLAMLIMNDVSIVEYY